MIKEKKQIKDQFNINQDKIKKEIEEPIKEAGYKLLDIKTYNEYNNFHLQIIIDKENGISVDDCVMITNIINPILDQNEELKEQYILEVSSKGVEENGPSSI